MPGFFELEKLPSIAVLLRVCAALLLRLMETCIDFARLALATNAVASTSTVRTTGKDKHSLQSVQGKIPKFYLGSSFGFERAASRNDTFLNRGKRCSQENVSYKTSEASLFHPLRLLPDLSKLLSPIIQYLFLYNPKMYQCI